MACSRRFRERTVVQRPGLPARTSPLHAIVGAAGLAVIGLAGPPRPSSADEAGSTTVPAPAAYAAVIAADEPLAHWPLSGSLEPAAVTAALPKSLEAGDGKPRFRPGPIPGGRSVDLGRGGWLRVPAAPALDADELTVEMIFQIKYPRSGALFGLRDGTATRFSLHYDDDSPTLRLWNGAQVIEFEADRPIMLNAWYHVALAIAPDEATVWLDGVRCRASGSGGLGAAATGLPFLVGCSNAAGTAERAEILAAHLAIHPRRLSAERIAARVAALGRPAAPRPRPDPAAAAAGVAARVAALERDHGVVVKHVYSVEEFLPEPWRSTSEAAGLPLEQMPRVLDEIEAFAAVVPAAVTRRDLETIYVVDHLKLNGSLVGALASGRSIYLCCGRPMFDIRCSLYHELSHILQVAHPIDDAAWTELLPRGFAYVGSAEGMNPFAFDDELRDDGFILRYSTTNRHEDIAVLSDWLFVRKQQTVDLCEEYPAIRRKVAALVAWYREIDPGYDFSFYDEAIRGTDAPRLSVAGAGERSDGAATSR